MTIKEANNQRIKKLTKEEWPGHYLEFEYDDKGLVISTKFNTQQARKSKRFIPRIRDIIIPDDWLLEDDWLDFH